jgi:hypothetical protein
MNTRGTVLEQALKAVSQQVPALRDSGGSPSLCRRGPAHTIDLRCVDRGQRRTLQRLGHRAYTKLLSVRCVDRPELPHSHDRTVRSALIGTTHFGVVKYHCSVHVCLAIRLPAQSYVHGRHCQPLALIAFKRRSTLRQRPQPAYLAQRVIWVGTTWHSRSQRFEVTFSSA